MKNFITLSVNFNCKKKVLSYFTIHGPNLYIIISTDASKQFTDSIIWSALSFNLATLNKLYNVSWATLKKKSSLSLTWKDKLKI